MAFNLNKLVQSECGGSNPLVAAAQQISTKQPVTNRYQQQPGIQPTTFVEEYIQQNPRIVNQPAPTSSLQYNMQYQPKLSQQLHQQPTTQNLWLNQSQPWDMKQPMQHHQILSQQAGTSAGDQLEIKYRNDMISQTKPTTQHDEIHSSKDDLQFWQALSQKYTGLSTDVEQKTTTNTTTNEATESLADLVISEEADKMFSDVDEYNFDERNPLKDQFEDPFSEGLKRLEQGDIPSAALLFEAAVQKEPENSVAWRYLGTTQAKNEKDREAIRALKNCLKLNELDQEARLAVAVSLANENYQYQASEHLVTWLVNHQKYSLGVSLDDFHLFDNELSNDPFYINSLHNKHYNYVRDKLVEAARMSPSDPDPDVQNALGVLFNMRGEYSKAVDCFKAALTKSNDSLLWNRLGATLANGNKSDEAVIAYRKALELSPGFLRSRYNLAISLIHLNAYDEAAKQLIQILNMQAAGKGSKNSQIRTRSITSSAIWNTMRTVATLLNRPELYPIIDGRDLTRCNAEIFKTSTLGSLEGGGGGGEGLANK